MTYANELRDTRERFLEEITRASTREDLDTLRTRYLGRKGLLKQLTASTALKDLSSEGRKEFGIAFNDLKAFIEDRISRALSDTIDANDVSGHPRVDLALPGTERTIGAIHPIAIVQMDLEAIFNGMGFTVLTGPEVVTEFHNFDALNIPGDHPARDMQDTYWLDNGMLLRTHTSANQVPALRKYGVPQRSVFPGRCFRHEKVDASHENTFYQLEGLMVDRDITVSNLIAVMKTVLAEVFRRDVEVRLRPGYFPFVEPGFELDLKCLLCEGRGCTTCRTGWVELIPCGMVHPRVLEYGGVDSSQFTGFAFGLGLTRLAMMRFGINEIRLFNSGDVRFYDQFNAFM